MTVKSITQVVVQNSDGSWDNRPSSSTTVVVPFIRTVPGSADPARAVSPAVNGMYDNDPLWGPI